MSSSYPESKCINCCASLDLDDKENNENQLPSPGGFFTLNCTSRVRFPLSPARIQEIPVGRALSTIFNLKNSLSSRFRWREKEYDDADVDDDASNSADNVDDERESLCFLLEDSPSLPICFVCHLVLNDLYRTYTEFSQLRKTNSFLGGKLAALENIRMENQNKKSRQCLKAKVFSSTTSHNEFSRKQKVSEAAHMEATNSGSEQCETEVNVHDIIDVKCEIFDEEELRDEMQDEFEQETVDLDLSSNSITSDLPDQSNHEHLDFQISPSTPKLSRSKRIRSNKACHSGPGGSFAAPNSLLEPNQNQNKKCYQVLESNETENNPQHVQVVRMESVKSETAFAIPTFSMTATAGIENEEDEECYPVDDIDPISQGRPRRSNIWTGSELQHSSNSTHGNMILSPQSQSHYSVTTPQVSSKLKSMAVSVPTSRAGIRQRKPAKQCLANLKLIKIRKNPINYNEYYEYIPNFASCRLCGEGVPRKHGNTTGLMVHLKNHHNIDLSKRIKHSNLNSNSNHVPVPTSAENPLFNSGSVSSTSLASGETSPPTATDDHRNNQHQHQDEHNTNTHFLANLANPCDPHLHPNPHSLLPQMPMHISMHFQDHGSSSTRQGQGPGQELPFSNVPGASSGPGSVPTGGSGDDRGVLSRKWGRKGQVKINYSDHFEFIVSEAGVDKAVCKICRKTISRTNSNTTSMRSHLFSFHKFKYLFETSEVPAHCRESYEGRIETD